MTPEEKARQQIDTMLAASGWVVQPKDKINLSAARGVAICELSFATGEPDYTLFVCGVVEELEAVVYANLQLAVRLSQFHFAEGRFPDNCGRRSVVDSVEIPPLHGGRIVSSVAGAFGSALRETRLCDR